MTSATRGLIDADLGGGVIKQRVARLGLGKSGGFVPLFCTARQSAFFVYGFSKNHRDNIDDDEEIAFKKAAAYVLGLSATHLAELIDQKQFMEVHDHGKKIPK